MIATRERERFRRRGLIRLERFLPAEKVACAREVVLRALERHGVWREGHWCLDALPRSSAPNAGAELVKETRRSRAFRDLITPELLDAIATLLDGRPVAPAMDTPQLLFTLPNARDWTVPHSIWHLDVPRVPDCGIPGVQLFTFLNAVEPGGGGTLVVAGSHRLLNDEGPIRSKEVKRRLKREPYFRDLMSKHVTDRGRFIDAPGRVGDVELQVVELCGRPGDVFLMDMRVLHTLAPNTARAPRIMLTQRFLLEALYGQLYGAAGSDTLSS